MKDEAEDRQIGDSGGPQPLSLRALARLAIIAAPSKVIRSLHPSSFILN